MGTVEISINRFAKLIDVCGRKLRNFCLCKDRVFLTCFHLAVLNMFGIRHKKSKVCYVKFRNTLQNVYLIKLCLTDKYFTDIHTCYA